MKKYLSLITLVFVVLSSCSFGQTASPAVAPAPVKAAKPTPPVDPVVLSNQMMITFMERMKGGNFPEAKTIAQQMIQGHEAIKDTETIENKSFSSLMEKRLYEINLAKEGKKTQVKWIQQPISDGFYFLAMLSFQAKNVSEALDYLQKAIQWNPVHSAYFVERGFMMLHSTQPDLAQAMIAYLKALELADNYQDFAAGLRGIGFVLIEKGDMDGAVACYLRSKLYDPQDKTADQEISFIRSRFPSAGKDLDGTKAVQILAQLRIPAGIDPIHVKVLLSIADEMGSTNRPKEQKALLKEALRLDPQNKDIQQRLSPMLK